MNNTTLAVLCAIGSLVTLVAGLTGYAQAFGFGSVMLIVLLSFMGLRAPGRPGRRVYAYLIAFGAIFIGLLALAFHLHDPTGSLRTFGGFPVGTAVLVYGISSIGLTMGVVYGLVFDRKVLPVEKQREFLDRFGPKQG